VERAVGLGGPSPFDEDIIVQCGCAFLAERPNVEPQKTFDTDSGWVFLGRRQWCVLRVADRGYIGVFPWWLLSKQRLM